jgi:5,10-methylenetetrahydromethanopterin reductase
MAARATHRLTIGTAVTNLITRDPAVVAGAFAALDLISDGRAILGVARGDTALRLIGREPPHLAEFEELVGRTRRYLRGEDVEVGDLRSRIAWLDPHEPPVVPINVFASGPKSLVLAARAGDLVTMSLGAEPDQVAWGLAQVRAVNPAVPVGALVVAATGMDRDDLREYVRGNASISTHFRRGAPAVLDPADHGVVAAVDHDYELYGHSAHDPQQVEDLPPDFIDRFCIIGEPEECADRLRGLMDLGLDHIVVVGGGLDSSIPLRLQMDMRFAQEVLPALR